ncbi:MAG: hypothetical protein QG642_86 [Patescibacteria group bacterium]|nr:hypothetical protein [Patescibacteria group bacterium]
MRFRTFTGGLQKLPQARGECNVALRTARPLYGEPTYGHDHDDRRCHGRTQHRRTVQVELDRRAETDSLQHRTVPAHLLQRRQRDACHQGTAEAQLRPTRADRADARVQPRADERHSSLGAR